MTDSSHRSFRVALRNRDFRYLLGGLAVSNAGDWLYGVALIVFVFDETHSAGWVAATSLLRLLPHVLFGTLGGVIADRYPRKLVMILSDLARAALMLILALAAAQSYPVLVALLISFLATAAGSAYGPATASMLPSVVETRSLAAANALISTVEHVTLIVGPAIGGLLLILGSPSLAFVVNGVTFLASAACVAAIRTHSAPQEVDQEASLWQRIAEGARAITASHEVAIPVWFFIGASFIYGEMLVLLVVVATERLGTGSDGVTVLTAAIGVGGMLAAAVTSRLAASNRTALILTGSNLCMGVPLALLSIVHSPPVAAGLMVSTGVGTIVVDVIAITLIQRSVEQSVTARVFGILESVGVAGILLGSLVAPVLLNAFGLTTALVVGGLGLPALSLLSLPSLTRVSRRAAERMRGLEGRVETLLGLGIFEGAPRQVIEAIAEEMDELRVEAGVTVVEEGDAPTDFYVIVGGELVVLSSGETGGAQVEVNQLGAGDYFGEIGLLEGIPRTATVRTTSQTVLYRISGDSFLDAVNQPATISGTLLDGIVGRLARTHPSHAVGAAATVPQ